MAFPRTCALAEIAWSPKERPAFADFLARLRTHLRRLDVQDVRYRAPLEYLPAP
jgi:hexosaminidase